MDSEDIKAILEILERCLEEVDEPENPDAILKFLTKNRSKIVSGIEALDEAYIDSRQ